MCLITYKSIFPIEYAIYLQFKQSNIGFQYSLNKKSYSWIRKGTQGKKYVYVTIEQGS